MFINNVYNLYYFITANNSDFIKSIDTENLNITDIEDRLLENETLGSYAYIYISDTQPVIAFLSGFGAPKIDSFSEFTNALFSKIAPNNSAQISFYPLSKMTTREHIDSLELVASAGFIIDRNSSMFNTAKELFGDDSEDDSIGEFRVTVSRKDGATLSDFTQKLIAKATGENTQISKLNVRGKVNPIAGVMAEYILDMNQQLTDDIPNLVSRSIQELVAEKAPVNSDVINASSSFCESEGIKLAEDHALFVTCSSPTIYTPSPEGVNLVGDSNGQT